MSAQFQNCLIEIHTEELPPKTLRQLLAAFDSLMQAALTQAQVPFTAIRQYGSPRRLALSIENLGGAQADQVIEKRGPALSLSHTPEGEPTQAFLGFLKSVGKKAEDLMQLETPKGQVWVSRELQTGRAIQMLLPELVGQALKSLPIAKTMRWGVGHESFVRPVQGVVMLYGDQVIPGQLFGLNSGRRTQGHRFLCKTPIDIESADTYEAQMQAGFVCVDLAKRQSDICRQIEALAQSQNAQAVIPEDLLEEVTQIVEWPVALLCQFDPAFLKVPQEALILSMQTHQKCFPLIDAQGRLLPQFVVISNLKSLRPECIIKGNERVVAARLSDAQFFYQTDLKKTLRAYLPELAKVTFHAKLGSVFSKTERLEGLVKALCERLKVDATGFVQAATICKSDLLSNMVGEFPELQGVMGKYYALAQGEAPEVAEAIETHYWPRFSKDALPPSLIGQVLSLADKLDTLCGIFGVNEKPTGSKDPFALRRQALGVIRLLSVLPQDFVLTDLLELALAQYQQLLPNPAQTQAELLAFFVDRLSHFYQEQGIEGNLLAAVLVSLGDRWSVQKLHHRIQLIQSFLKEATAPGLIQSHKRVFNVLKHASSSKVCDENVLQEAAEKDLYQALMRFEVSADDHLNLAYLAGLQGLIEAFFDQVMVMAEDPRVRENRLALMQQLNQAYLSVADFRVL